MSREKTKLVKVRLTLDEHRRLGALARSERNVSAYIRKQIFGRRGDILLCLAGIHSSTLQIARAVSQNTDILGLIQVLAYLVVIERHLNELATRSKK